MSGILVPADLPGIGLAELLELAALQTRIDRKYVLPRADAERVLASLDRSTRALEVDGIRASQYESLYFDTDDLLSYRMAALGRRRRFKLRTRSYLDSGAAYLELKTKGARSATVKERLEYELEHRDELTPEGAAYAAAPLGELGVPDPDRLRPTLVTRYRRETLYLPGTGSRATVDTDLAWEDADGAHLELPGLAIVESKSAGAASELDRLLWSRGHRPVRVSKFGTGLAALRPDLPSHKWNRVLRRHFAAAA
ncbi:polyphosphate polymerase domain-containing protein [Homoserinibacter sp. GY 40078]|uniref:polyphosphate polymerase domain-containing protein n=1 Tax=Homoserinibacter sp. GY 40078 TaxID=2603275 RepID=UPI0011CC49F9|nr:polyphosphate polymerase domain-containing protein [Homoserinibacter sp. GY 40078]TXK19448.1 polyphosphate polymerase domain-containing protein [Homoserinibacter sp. GY 40078]